MCARGRAGRARRYRGRARRYRERSGGGTGHQGQPGTEGSREGPRRAGPGALRALRAGPPRVGIWGGGLRPEGAAAASSRRVPGLDPPERSRLGRVGVEGSGTASL